MKMFLKVKQLKANPLRLTEEDKENDLNLRIERFCVVIVCLLYYIYTSFNGLIEI